MFITQNTMLQCYSSVLLALFLLLQGCFAPPVTHDKKGNEVEGEHHNLEEQEADLGGLEDYMEYHRYLKEVVNALESDPEFRTKLEKADESEIKSGKIAEELEFVSHHVRTRLDEIKRRELQRLKELVERKMKLEQLDSNAIDPEDPIHNHLDHGNPHTFEIEDLKKLIAKTTEDLAEADKKRKEDFKKYEMEKELKKQQKLNSTTGEEHEKLEKEFKEMESKHKKHEKLHEPGHQAQLEEVWQEQDQMQQDFDPKTFFMLHDLDANGLWDQEEVKALFIKELDKMYQEGAPEDDMRERIEEMERMRESVFNEMDKNRDGFIDFHEFYKQATSKDFKEDHGWKGLDEQTRPYTDEELAQMARFYQETQRNAGNLGHQGISIHQQGGYPNPQQAGYHQQQGYQPQQGGYQQQQNPGGYPNQQQNPGGYPNQQQPGGYQPHQQHGGYQPPPGGYQQVPQGQFQAGQVPQMAPQQFGNQQHPNQVQNQPNQAQIHQQQQIQQPGQVNQQNQQQGQVYQQQHQQQPNQQPNIQLNQGAHLPNQQVPLVKEQISNIANPQLNMV